MDKNQIVTVELAAGIRLKIYGQITARMERADFNPVDFEALDLGFELPAGWPVDVNAQPTLAQLVVVARKLDMRIIIGDLDLMHRCEKEQKD